MSSKTHLLLAERRRILAGDPPQLRRHEPFEFRPTTKSAKSQAASAGFFSGPWMPAFAAGLVLVVVVVTGMIGSRSGSSAGSDGPRSRPSTFDTTTSIAPVAIAPETTLVRHHQDGLRRLRWRWVRQATTSCSCSSGSPISGSNQGRSTDSSAAAPSRRCGRTRSSSATSSGRRSRNSATRRVVTNDLWQQMQEPSVQILPRRPNTGKHVEIYLPLQVLALFDENNKAIFITHISTGELNPDGTDATFCETATYTTDIHGNPLAEPEDKEICAEAKTPPGVFRLKRYEDGQHVSPLGGMKNPWYFNYGIAIHGAQNVPTPSGVARLRADEQRPRRRVPVARREGQCRVRVGLRRPRARGLHREGVARLRSTGPTPTPRRPPRRRRRSRPPRSCRRRLPRRPRTRDDDRAGHDGSSDDRGPHHPPPTTAPRPRRVHPDRSHPARTTPEAYGGDLRSTR